MKISIAIACLLVLSGCGRNKENKQEIADDKPGDGEYYLLTGTYTSGTSKGIYVYRFNENTGQTDSVSMIEGISNPSYLNISDSDHVYSVSEDTGDSATLNAFDFNNGKLGLINHQKTKGDHPCYVGIDPRGTFAVTANYTGGNLTVFPIEKDGSLREASQVIILPSNKGISHMHTVAFSPDRKYLFATDLGRDIIYRFNIPDPVVNGRFVDESSVKEFAMESASGPRHLAFHPNGNFLYSINELSGKVTAFEYRNGDLSAIQYISSDTTSGSEKKGSADIHLSPDGKFLYSSNRLRADGIAIFSVDAITGRLTSIGYQQTGIHPRNFIITPNGKYLLVANRDSNNIQIFERDKETGLLNNTGKEIRLDKPVCLKLVPTVSIDN